MDVSIQPLNPLAHQLDEFNCAEPDLNQWLRTMAGQHRRRNISSTFVAVDDAAPHTIVGYYALTVAEISKGDLPDQLKRMPQSVPVIRLGRLAVDRRFQGQGYGRDLLADAILRAGSQVAGAGLVVDALHAKAADFYRNLGFAPFPSDPLKLFFPLANLR